MDERTPATAPVKAPASTEPASPASPVLDLDGLERRIRETRAIGVFTKLELKSQVEDLLEDVDQFHRSRSKLTLGQLKEHFNLLVMKLLVLLEKKDPPLHQDIARARVALWNKLADPIEFSSMRGT